MRAPRSLLITALVLVILSGVSPGSAAQEGTMTIGVHVTLVSRWLDDQWDPKSPWHDPRVRMAASLDGEIWALMDEGETLLKAGDCLIQRGTNHAWSNRTDTPCRVAFILVNAHPA